MTTKVIQDVSGSNQEVVVLVPGDAVTSVAVTAPITNSGTATAPNINVSNATNAAVGVVQLAGSLGGTATAPTLSATGVTAATYTNPSSVTVNGEGRITAITSGTGSPTKSFTNSTGTTIAAVKAVNIKSDGTIQLANTSSGNNLRVHGFTVAAINTGSSGVVQSSGLLAGFTGLTIGADYWHDSATPGSITATAPTATGTRSQYVGWAMSATELWIELERPLLRA